MRLGGAPEDVEPEEEEAGGGSGSHRAAVRLRSPCIPPASPQPSHLIVVRARRGRSSSNGGSGHVPSPHEKPPSADRVHLRPLPVR